MLASLLLLSSLAVASPRTDVGAGKNFGLGVELGWVECVTGKYFLSDNQGIAFHVGGSTMGLGGGYLDARVQYEMRVLELFDWKFADFGGYWNAGVATRQWLDGALTQSFQLGATGGVGVEMRFKEAPAAVYGETDLRIYAIGPTTGTYDGIRQFGGVTTIGGRWYF
jgi:hypothetical protein